jgi:hypothetical protein
MTVIPKPPNNYSTHELDPANMNDTAILRVRAPDGNSNRGIQAMEASSSSVSPRELPEKIGIRTFSFFLKRGDVEQLSRELKQAENSKDAGAQLLEYRRIREKARDKLINLNGSSSLAAMGTAAALGWGIVTLLGLGAYFIPLVMFVALPLKSLNMTSQPANRLSAIFHTANNKIDAIVQNPNIPKLSRSSQLEAVLHIFPEIKEKFLVSSIRKNPVLRKGSDNQPGRSKLKDRYYS